jgi:electron transfer flavoprotein beta subunit
MKIVVCIKRVPSTEATVRISADGKSLDPTGVEYILSPFDEIALEEALRIKEKLGSVQQSGVPTTVGSEVIALTVGTAEAASTLRTCLAMGADKGIIIKDDQTYKRDSYAIAQAISTVLKEVSPDIIFFGKQAVDDDNSQVPAMVSYIMNIPFVSLVVKFELAGNTATVQREVDGGREILEVTLPAAFSAQKGLNEPRYPSLKGIMAAKKKPIEEKAANFPSPSLETIKMEYPPSRAPGRIVGKGVDAVPQLVKLLKEEAKII